MAALRLDGLIPPMNLRSAGMARPLAPGTRIEFCDLIGEVVHDDGSSRIDVICEGSQMRWWWKFEGVERRVIGTAEAAIS